MLRRLDQLLANLGYCSRRGARDFLRAHEVLVDRIPVGDPSQKVSPSAVRVDGAPLDHPDGILVMLHKPVGLVCSHDASEGPSVYSLLPDRWRNRSPQLTTVGRLDKETSGLLLITDQGPLVHRLTAPRHHVAKRYRARVDGAIPTSLIDLFGAGQLTLEGERSPCAPARLEIAGKHEALLELTEGRYHQVRRMFASQGLTVLTLHRESFGGLSLGDLAPGSCRELPLSYFD
ncbi:MAG: rRNA pseudouridine synthase [Opitutaceae bacterium]|nr:rRNA pseudouridine synthase [Opitutaceae bacterium]